MDEMSHPALNGHRQGTTQPDATGRPSRTRIKHYIGLYDGAGITVSRALVVITLSAVLWALIYLRWSMAWSVALAALQLERVREVRPSMHPYRRQGHPQRRGWLHEPKLDGYRFQIVKGTRAVRLYSRNGYDWTKRLPGFADAFQGLPCRSATLDGKLVLPDEDGAPDFEGLSASVRPLKSTS